MKRRLFSVILILCFLLSAQTSAWADVNSADLRHSVAYVQISVDLNGKTLDFSSGTCFFVGEEGKDPQYAVTNNHVVSLFTAFGSGQNVGISYQTWVKILMSKNISKETASALWSIFVGEAEVSDIRAHVNVYFSQDSYVEAYVMETDEISDFAVIRLEKPTSQRTALPIALPDQSIVGLDCYAVGYPGIADSSTFENVEKLGENDASISKGTISRLVTETGTGVPRIQTDTIIRHGNSGGPLVLGANGAAVGITTGTIGTSDEVVNYCVSMEIVKPVLDRQNVPYTLLTYPETPVSTEEPVIETEQPVIETEAPAPVPGLPVWAYVLIAAAVVAVAALLLRGRKKPAAAPMPATAPAPKAVPAQKRAARSDDYGYRIQGVSGALEGKRFSVPAGAPVTVGRNPQECGIVLPPDTPGVSGRHCSVWIDKGAVYVMDLGSSHGTFLAPGRRLAANQAVKLQEGDIVWLGGEAQSFVLTKKRGN